MKPAEATIEGLVAAAYNWLMAGEPKKALKFFRAAMKQATA